MKRSLDWNQVFEDTFKSNTDAMIGRHNKLYTRPFVNAIK